MLFWTTVKVGLKSLWANKLRSFLAMLGIIIGVGAVIAMLAIGAGARRQVMAQISSRGTNLLVITPGQTMFGGVTGGARQNLTIADAKAILGLPQVQFIAPVASGNYQVKYGPKNQPTPVVGTTSTYLPIRAFELERGRDFSEMDEDNRARIAILGPAVVEKLFEKEEPIGKIVKVRGVNFRVIGVTKAKGDQGWFNVDNQVFIPYTTALEKVIGVDYLREIDVQARDADQLNALQDSITELLRQRHKLINGMDNDFQIRNQADFIEMAMQVNRTFTMLLGGIASISLLVGGIGIMNIMLVTVTERTREIGIRKAIGATHRSIMVQFLIETVIISGLGGLFGMLFGTGAALLLPKLTPFSTHVEPVGVVLALSFSVFVGVFFGWYPARRAALLPPVEALRYE